MACKGDVEAAVRAMVVRHRDAARAALAPGWSVKRHGKDAVQEIAVALCAAPLARTKTRGGKVTVFLTRSDAAKWAAALQTADSLAWLESLLAPPKAAGAPERTADPPAGERGGLMAKKKKAESVAVAPHPWLQIREHWADSELGRLRKEGYDFMLSVLDKLEDGGSLWQVGFWAGRAGVGKSLRGLERFYPEVAHGRATGERLRKIMEQLRKREEALEKQEDPK